MQLCGAIEGWQCHGYTGKGALVGALAALGGLDRVPACALFVTSPTYNGLGASLYENEFVKDEWQSELVYAILDREWLGGADRR